MIRGLVALAAWVFFAILMLRALPTAQNGLIVLNGKALLIALVVAVALVPAANYFLTRVVGSEEEE